MNAISASCLSLIAQPVLENLIGGVRKRAGDPADADVGLEQVVSELLALLPCLLQRHLKQREVARRARRCP